jgi:hypothetical protein
LKLKKDAIQLFATDDQKQVQASDPDSEARLDSQAATPLIPVRYRVVA